MLAPKGPTFDRRWLTAVLIAFAIEVAMFVVVSSMPLPSDEANSLLNDTQGLVTQIQNEPLALKTLNIFSNNAGIAIFYFVPVYGWLRFLLVTVATGQVVSALSSSSGIPAVLLLVTTFLSPHAWVELMAYAVAIAESFMLVYALFARRLRPELSRASASFLVVILMLMFAALLEAITIEYTLAGYVYAWLVAVVAGVIVFYFIRRSRRSPPSAYTSPPPAPMGIPATAPPPP